MPTENVINRDFHDLFSSQTVRYEIPFFQRGYAWNKRQWKQLMDDIQDQVFEHVEENRFEESEHFFGPVVVLEKKNAPHPSLKRYYVIDGQQRITTVYLMLAIIKRELEKHTHLSQKATEVAGEISDLITNKIESDDDYLKLKVFSSKGDRLPTYYTLYKENPTTPYLSEDQQLYIQGKNNIDQFERFFEKRIAGKNVDDLENLYLAITKSLKIVWIPLDEEKDDAQAIFESLNDAGMPLSAAELLCNFLFRPLTNEKTNIHEKLHNEKWLKAQKEVGHDNFEEYLRNLFSIGENKRVGKNRRMYVHFKNRNRNLEESKANQVLDTICISAKHFNRVSQPLKFKHPVKEILHCLIGINSTNVSAHLPYTMSVLIELEKESITESEAVDLLRELYTLIIRRKVANLRTTKYDTFFPSLLEKVIHEENKVLAFQDLTRKENLWVSNQEFKQAFLSKELYNSRELNFTRHVLQKIDQSLQSFGELPDYSTISTIEHVLPQNPNQDWLTYIGEDNKNPDLHRIINTIGNLCLNSGSANSSKGRKSFTEKVNDYNNLCALNRDLESRNEPWNISAIEKRSSDLADQAIMVWSWNDKTNL